MIKGQKDIQQGLDPVIDLRGTSRNKKIWAPLVLDTILELRGKQRELMNLTDIKFLTT